jgi:predicted AAA+ superfamily ATPase
MLTRTLTATLRASRKSVLLLGPRQTGKSTLIGELAPNLTINLAHEATYLEFARNPRELEERLAPLAARGRPATVFLDEVQRLPSLLNTLQALLDRPRNPIRFFLSGSSARKLRRGGANLLPGRIHTYHLGPLTAREIGPDLDTRQALATGTLPGIFTEVDRREREKTLRSYAATYLKEEIQAESLTRNVEGFARFLGTAAEWAGHHLDLAKLAQAAQIPRQSAVRYFEILEDTLIVRRAEPFTKSLSRRLVQHPKFFFFDVGVRNGLLGSFDLGADRMGPLFEHLVFSQLAAAAAARDVEIRISSWRTEHGAEVDFIVELEGETWAIELKASHTVPSGAFRGLRSFADHHGKKHRAVLWYLGEQAKRIDGVDVLPWRDGLRAMDL